MLGPEIDVAGDSPEQKREQAMFRQLAMARELQSSPAWDWFVKVLTQRAEALERDLLDVQKTLDVRQEDRHRGEASVYRRVPRLVEEMAAKHKRAAEKAAQKEQQQ